MTPAEHNFTAYADTLFDTFIAILDPNGVAVDLTGSTPRMEVREKCGETPVLTFDEASGTILDVNLPNGQFRLSMPSNLITDEIVGTYQYDLALLQTGATERPLRGQFTIQNTETRAATP